MLLRVLSLCVLLVGCGTSSVESPQDPVEASFPEDWFGTWSGEITKTAASGEFRCFGLDLTVGPTEDPGRFEWTIGYRLRDGLDGEEVYTLLERDPTVGHYAMDGGDGIEIEARAKGDLVTIWFADRNGPSCHSLTILKLRDRGRPDERIEYERYTTSLDPDSITETRFPEREGTGLRSISWRPYQVHSWLVRTWRHGVLRRR